WLPLAVMPSGPLRSTWAVPKEWSVIMEARRGLGWLPDIPKPTDYTEEHPAVAPLLAQTGLRMRVAAQSVFGANETGAGGLSAPAIPSRQDLRAYFSPIEDQGQLGSCTANAAVALLES